MKTNLLINDFITISIHFYRLIDAVFPYTVSAVPLMKLANEKIISPNGVGMAFFKTFFASNNQVFVQWNCLLIR